MRSDIEVKRLKGLPDELRKEIAAAREERGWSQAELGRRVGLPQAHISGIETGKVSPRFNTLLDLVRVLGYDLLLAERSLVPAARALIRGHRNRAADGDEGERPMYAANDEEDRDDS